MNFSIKYESTPPTMLDGGKETGYCQHDVRHLSGAGAFRYVVNHISIQNPASPFESYVEIGYSQSILSDYTTYNYGFSGLSEHSTGSDWADSLNKIFDDLYTDKDRKSFKLSCDYDLTDNKYTILVDFGEYETDRCVQIKFNKSARRVFGFDMIDYVPDESQTFIGEESYVDVQTLMIQTTAPIFSTHYISLDTVPPINRTVTGVIAILNRHEDYLFVNNNIPVEFRTKPEHTFFEYQVYDNRNRKVPVTFRINYTVHCQF